MDKENNRCIFPAIDDKNDYYDNLTPRSDTSPMKLVSIMQTKVNNEGDEVKLSRDNKF
jgi:hypothetical protein